MYNFVISDANDTENSTTNRSPKPVPSHVLHEVYRTVEGEEKNYVVKLGEIKHAITDSTETGESSRIIPVQEPSQAELDLLMKYAADITKAGEVNPTGPDKEGNPTEERRMSSRKVLPEDQKPLYSHIDGDFLYEYFE
ncbi:glucuronyl hydrolase [Perkinsela sp. CCAP 1560/4]|nr:glucuronyl hydrolase [Perkinsela sp. CCAP 1560/4]|eukprot:KNH07505.1 glucuronyl hydrolase [Perkinsela sp. CCAP 1560/4]